MVRESHKEIIRSYVEAYNAFDLDGMENLLHPDVLFRNFSQGEMNAETKGLEAFRALAEQSARIFASRCQTIKGYRGTEDGYIEVEIGYDAVLAADLPNGWKAGEKLQLQGKSVFGIHEGKIRLIEDYS